ncbi:MAG: hypothetical protein K9G60_00005, partial [Pseudolabrys sp.]|nr:hypothetical protein [Pseudolabrys sp.]
MVSTARSGVVDAKIVLFNKGGRDPRLEKLTRGEAVPREFFYGFFDIEKAGYLAAMMSSSGSVPGFRGAVANIVERTFARIAGIGVRPFSAGLTLNRLAGARVAISFTDGFSLSIGCAFGRPRRDLILIGGFQGLCDIEGRAPRPLRGLVRRIIARSVAGLDHVFFLGP